MKRFFLIWGTVIVSFLVITQILFSVPAPFEWLVPVWDANGFISFVGSSALGIIALWQNQKYREENNCLTSAIHLIKNTKCSSVHIIGDISQGCRFNKYYPDNGEVQNQIVYYRQGTKKTGIYLTINYQQVAGPFPERFMIDEISICEEVTSDKKAVSSSELVTNDIQPKLVMATDKQGEFTCSIGVFDEHLLEILSQENIKFTISYTLKLFTSIGNDTYISEFYCFADILPVDIDVFHRGISENLDYLVQYKKTYKQKK